MAAKGTIAAIAAGGALPIAIGGRGDDACLHGIADFLRACGNEIQNGGILLLGCEISGSGRVAFFGIADRHDGGAAAFGKVMV